MATPRPTLKTRGRAIAPLTSVTSWRQAERPKVVLDAIKKTHSLAWSPALLDALLDELYVTNDVEAILGAPLHHLPRRHYPRAIAIALILRHSWRSDDLEWITGRLR